jgi:hypothetical protein
LSIYLDVYVVLSKRRRVESIHSRRVTKVSDAMKEVWAAGP